MINLDKINNSLPEGYSLEEKQGYYLLRKTSDDDVPVFYPKNQFSDNEKLLFSLNQVIEKHEYRMSGKRLKSSNEPSQTEEQDLEQRLEEKGLSLVE